MYTYCANHPYHRPQKDSVPIGPVYAGMDRALWQPSPDTEDIREHLLHIVQTPEEHSDEGYHFFSLGARDKAILQLLEWREPRLISALESLSERPEIAHVRESFEETIRLVRERFKEDPEG